MDDLVILNDPPQPQRETARIRQGLSVRVDSGLVKAFLETCQSHNLTRSELMETILWNALGNPLLSFEPGFYAEQQKESSRGPHEEQGAEKRGTETSEMAQKMR